MDIKISDLTQEIIQEMINEEAKTHAPKKVRPHINVPSDGQIQELMEIVSGTEMEIPVLLAAFGPMRRGEICALDSNHVCGNIVHVEYATRYATRHTKNPIKHQCH